MYEINTDSTDLSLRRSYRWTHTHEYTTPLCHLFTLAWGCVCLWMWMCVHMHVCCIKLIIALMRCEDVYVLSLRAIILSGVFLCCSPSCQEATLNPHWSVQSQDFTIQHIPISYHTDPSTDGEISLYSSSTHTHAKPPHMLLWDKTACLVMPDHCDSTNPVQHKTATVNHQVCSVCVCVRAWVCFCVRV